MARVFVARHGETTWNAVGRYQGRLETPLSPLGQAQAQALCGALHERGVARIVSSPLSRCVQTALPLRVKRGVPAEIEPLLTEIAHGTWEGRYRDEIARSEPELYYEWREHPERVRFAGGEGLSDVLERWQAFVSSFDASRPALLMTHDVVVRVALLERTGREVGELRGVRVPNAAYAEFEVAEDGWTLIDPCVDAHLAGLEADLNRQAL